MSAGRGGARPEKPCVGRRFTAKKVDEFVKLGIEPDYKDAARLRKYLNAQGKILPRRRTGLTARTQRRLAVAIKRARHLALLPFVGG